MAHFFEKRDPWGNGLAVWVLAGMMFVIPVAVLGLRDTRMENEVHNWVAADNPQTKAYHWFEQHFPGEEAMLFTWEGSSLDDPRVAAFVKSLRGTIDGNGIRRGGLKLVDEVTTPRELIDQMVKHDVSQDEAIEHLRGVLIGAGKLRVQLTDLGRAEKTQTIDLLRQTAREKFGLEINIVAPETLSPVSTDDTQAAETASTLAAATREHDFQVTWPGMHADEFQIKVFREMALLLQLSGVSARNNSAQLIEDCFVVPGSPVALAITLSEAGQADRAAAIAALQQSAEQAGIPAEKIHIGGRGVSGTALNEEVRKSVWNSAAPLVRPQERSVVLLSGLIGGLLSLWMLRSWRLAALVLGVSYFTTLICTAIVPMTGGVMTMVLVVMPPLLLVTTLSGSIHLANYWKHAASIKPSAAVLDAVRVARSPVIWASLTTAIGLASLMTSSLRPVRDFGLYSAVGTVISLVVILYGLPSLLQVWPAQAPRTSELDSHGWRAWGALLVRRYRIVLAGSCAACAVAIYGLAYFHTETKVIRYFADHSRIVRDYAYLEENLAGIVPVEIVVRFDQDAQNELKFLERADLVRRIEERMRQIPDVSGTIALTDFLPTIAPPPDTAKPVQKAKYAATSRTIEERVKTGTQAAAASHLLASAKEGSDFNAAGDELWRVTARVAIMSKLHYGTLTKQLDDICQSVLRHTSGQTEDKFRVAGAPVLYHPGASHVVTGMVPLFLATQEALLVSLINSFALAFATIALVMMYLLRNVWAGLLAMLPNVLPIGAVFGLISWYGLAVDVGTIVTASIALGIAVDETLHLVNWYRLGIEAGKTRNAAVLNALGHCGPAMWQTSCVVGLSLLVLYPADLVLISRFGWLMAALMGAALFANITITPVLLAGPMGAILENAHRKRSVEVTRAEILKVTPAPTMVVPPVIADAPHSGPGGTAAEPHRRPHREPSTRRSRRTDSGSAS